ncbi:MAG: hypothetical protein JXR95_03320 [Deltaproteobacteria bacterium]|nr:hypothetical protein [Deltaproteobacteria bacterium]
MGFISSLFNKEERAARSLEKNLKVSVNKRLQPEERFNALIALRNNGSPEAIYGLLRRFTIIAEGKGGIVVDEEEKEYVFKSIIAFGSESLPEIRKFVFAKEGPAVNPVHSISQALELYSKIVTSDEKVRELLNDLIEANPAGYDREPLRKEEILNFLIDSQDGGLGKNVVQYLEDMNETVRFLAVEYLLKFVDDEISMEPLLELFLPDREESLRIKNKVIAAIIEREWSIKTIRSYIEPLINENEFQILRGEKIVPKKRK